MLEGFAERFSLAVNNGGLTIAEICRRTGIDRHRIYDYMNGNREPKVLRLARLCKLLNVSADWLLFGRSNNDNT